MCERRKKGFVVVLFFEYLVEIYRNDAKYCTSCEVSGQLVNNQSDLLIEFLFI